MSRGDVVAVTSSPLGSFPLAAPAGCAQHGFGLVSPQPRALCNRATLSRVFVPIRGGAAVSSRGGGWWSQCNRATKSRVCSLWLWLWLCAAVPCPPLSRPRSRAPHACASRGSFCWCCPLYPPDCRVLRRLVLLVLPSLPARLSCS